MERAVSPGAVANADSLQFFRRLAERLSP